MKPFLFLLLILVCGPFAWAELAEGYGIPVVGWPEHELGYAISKSRNELELEHFGQFRFLAFEKDRQLIAYEEELGLAVVRSIDEQFLYLRSDGRESERRLGGADRIYGRATFSRDGSMLLATGLQSETYATMIDCFEVATGDLLWTRSYNFWADVSVLRSVDKILVGGARVQDYEGVDAFQLLDLKTGTMLDRLERVDLQGLGNGGDPWVASEAGIWVFPFQYRLLRVDGRAGTLRWSEAFVNRNATISYDGRFLVEWVNNLILRARVIGIAPGAASYSFSDFPGFTSSLDQGPIAWSRDSRYLYLARASGAVEKWDFANGRLVGSFQAGAMALSRLEESPNGERLFAIGLTNSSSLRFVEFDTASFGKLSEREWEQDFHTSSDRFGTVRIGGGWSFEVIQDKSKLSLTVNDTAYERDLSGGVFRERVPSDFPRWVKGGAFVSGLGKFRLVWSDGSVADFAAGTLEPLGVAWKSALLRFAQDVVIDAKTGAVGAAVGNDFFVFNAGSGEQVYRTSGLRNVYRTDGIGKAGRFALIDKVGEGDSGERGVFDMEDSRFVLRVNDLAGWTEGLELSPSGDHLARLSRSDGRQFFEAYEVATGRQIVAEELSVRNGSFAFSGDERFLYFAASQPDSDSGYQSQIWRLDLLSEDLEMVLDLTWLGSSWRPQALSTLAGGAGLLVRSPLDALYTVDVANGAVSAIKSMRNGFGAKSARDLETQFIAAGPRSYLFFAGTGRAEMGKLGLSEKGQVGLSLIDFETLRLDYEEAGGSLRMIWRSDDGRRWIDDGMPIDGPEIRLERIAGKLVRFVR